MFARQDILGLEQQTHGQQRKPKKQQKINQNKTYSSVSSCNLKFKSIFGICNKKLYTLSSVSFRLGHSSMLPEFPQRFVLL